MMERCFDSLSQEEFGLYFKNFTAEQIGNTILKIYNESSSDLSFSLAYFKKLDVLGIEILFYLMKKAKDHEFLHFHNAYVIKDFHEKYPKLIERNIIEFIYNLDISSPYQFEFFIEYLIEIL